MSRWAALLAVQEHDTRADQLNHRLATLSLRSDLAQLEDDVRSIDEQLADAQRRRDELGRSQQRLEDEIASLTERANQAEKQLYSGSVTNPRELQALQDDVASIRRRIGQLEDDELEIMELVEPVDAERSQLAGKRERLDAEGQRLRAALGEAESELSELLAAVRAEREAAASEVSDELWPEYDKLRARLGGVGIARLVGSACQGCHLALPAVEVDRIRKLPLDEAVHCEECGRLLVRD
jgi:predicted  nucleic acid-binding Zn-ribbon protein